MRIVIVLLLLLSRTAQADDAPADPAGEMRRYFRGELLGGLALIGMGAVGVGAGATLLATSDRAAVEGAAYPLLGFGIAHLAAGVLVDVSAAKRLRAFGRGEPASWVRREQQRMRGVATQFRVLKVIEGVGIAGGVGLAVYGHDRDRPRLVGVGLALAGELAATLVFDVIAARRAARYRRALAGIAF